MRYISLLIVALITACSPVSRVAINRTFRNLENQFHHHAGFVLYDTQKKKTLASYKGNRYFTPASNTKVLTFYTALTILGDSVPALQYQVQNDSLIFRGTADPSFLYSETHHSSRVLDLLKSFPGELYLADNPMYTTPLGPGWAWSDYRHSYSVERSSFPAYGNYFTLSRAPSGKAHVFPAYFKKYFRLTDSLDRTQVIRDFGTNWLDYAPGKNTPRPETWEIPFKPTPVVVADLLADTLKKRVALLPEQRDWSRAHLIYSVPADSLYKTMMQESDNFISEQLLMMCGWILTDSLKPEAAIRYMLNTHLSSLPDKLIWVDGSGLSRYNLTTPRNMVYLWEKVSSRVSYNRLFALLAAGGKSGTLRNWYGAEKPYVYGKTGTLSNNHCLSGFLITRKNRILIFSFMNSNYVAPVSELRKQMEKILKHIYDKM